MTIKKFLFSLVLLAIFVLAVVACSGTKSICPAYSDVETEQPADPNS
jgi:hypothetical protein